MRSCETESTTSARPVRRQRRRGALGVGAGRHKVEVFRETHDMAASGEAAGGSFTLTSQRAWRARSCSGLEIQDDAQSGQPERQR